MTPVVYNFWRVKKKMMLAVAALVLGVVVLVIALSAHRISKDLKKQFDAAVQGQQPDVNAAVAAALKSDITFEGNVVIKKDLNVGSDATIEGNLFIAQIPYGNTPTSASYCGVEPMCNK